MATSQTPSTNVSNPQPPRRPKRGVPEGLWLRCPGCQQTIFRKEAERALGVCPECDYHWYVSAQQRIEQVLDEGTFEEWDAELEPTDPLGFADKKPYRDRLKAEQARTGLRDAAVAGTGMIRARRVAFGVTDSAFIMGSMGSVVGEKLTRLIERATAAAVAADHHQRLGRRGPDARRHLVADANGQGLGGPGALRRRPAGCSSPCSPIRRWAASRPALPRWATSSSPSPRRSSALPARARFKPRSASSCPRAFRPASSCWNTATSTASCAARDLKSEIARAIDYCGKMNRETRSRALTACASAACMRSLSRQDATGSLACLHSCA